MNYSHQAFADVTRLVNHVARATPESAHEVLALLAEAIGILANHPRIGRPVEQDLRELVISRGRSGYVALYDFDDRRGVVSVLAIRHQLEVGYPDE